MNRNRQQIEPIQGLVRGHIGGSVKGSVIPELRHGEKLIASCRLVCGKSTQILFEATIHDLSLSIALRMICRAVMELGTTVSHNSTPESAEENEMVCHNPCREFGLESYEMGPFCIFIHNYHNSFIPVR